MNLFLEIYHLLSDYLIYSGHNKKIDVIETLGHLHSSGYFEDKNVIKLFLKIYRIFDQYGSDD